MFSKVKEIEERFNEIENELARPESVHDQKIYQKYLKETQQSLSDHQCYRK